MFGLLLNKNRLYGKCLGEFWDSKGTTVPLEVSLEDSVLQDLKMLQKMQE